jgi:hypothetical protein
MKKTLFLVLAILLCCCGIVSAWTIQSENYKGTINFFGDGTAVAVIDGYPMTEFNWKLMEIQPVGKYLYEATYFGYRVQFTYDPVAQEITSPQFPGARLV